MKKDELASSSIMKVICVTILLVLCSGIAVMAFNTQINSVKIIASNDQELEILTAKRRVADILEENHIVILPNEKVTPSMDSEIDDLKTIKISKIHSSEENEESVVDITVDEIVNSYGEVTEKIVVETQEIPFETVTKDVSNTTDNTTKVLRQGKNGVREVKYRVKYENQIEISKTEISNIVITQPVDKLVQVSNKQNIAARSADRTTSGGQNSLASKVEGKTPTIKTMNISAYTASTCDKAPGSPGYGRTSSGAMASSWYTLAAGKGLPVGTVVYIPYFKDKPNGGWFVVQDRGGAISNNKLDVYMSTYSECVSFGRRNLEAYVYQ